MERGEVSVLLGHEHPSSLDDYIARGGGTALSQTLQRSPDAVIEEVARSGLRGRGGAGFPTWKKWQAVRNHACPTRYVVCNAADGEPGTFKDRYLIRNDPYQMLEGLAIAAHVVAATKAFVATKGIFRREIAILRRAVAEMRGSDMLGRVPVEIVEGPDEYLFGEEKALLEVIEGNDPLPRILLPYQVGLFATHGRENPTVVNNAETLAHVPHIVREGADRFRSFGTETSPGTMIFTLCGDVARPGVYELPLGLPMQRALCDVGGATPGTIKAIFPGASHGIVTRARLDTPMDFDSMTAIGSGLGSAGFVVYDTSACIVAATLGFVHFLTIESCAQCPACKHGSAEIAECLERIERGEGSETDIETVLARSATVTGGQRCALPTGAAHLVRSAVGSFGDEFRQHLGGTCPRPRGLVFPKLVDLDAADGWITDDRYRWKQPDWSYAPSDSVATRADAAEGAA
ncbi:MAG: NADH-ubiquinone oxidoreductase-F iron-sulfur binding region domain-containing protein [Actinomycetota bacterium]